MPAAICLLMLQLTLACAQQPPPPAAPVAADAENASYIIGPGDTVQIFVWQNPELSMSVPVRPDGKISTPLVEDMVAVGKTPAILASDIQAVLGEFIRNPQVNVIVSNPVGTLNQVKVIGQVKTPSGVPFREGLKVLDVVLLVGGVTEFAAPNRTKLIRRKNGAESATRVRLGDLLERGDLSQNLALQPGDVLVVPQSMF
jgi:polysaccharide export outer membrane protein